MAFEAIPVEKKVPLGYKRVLDKVERPLSRLSELSNQTTLTDEEKREAGRLLHTIGAAALRAVERDVKRNFPGISLNRATFEGDVKKFEEHFGHPPSVDDETGKVDVDCSTNAILQTLLFSRLGADKTGVFNMNEHIVPTVKIGGQTVVLERKLFDRPTPPNVRDYLKEMIKARDDESHPMHSIAVDAVEKKKFDISDLAGRISYYGGHESSLGVAHFNVGVSYHSLGLTENAKESYREAIRLNSSDGQPRWW